MELDLCLSGAHRFGGLEYWGGGFNACPCEKLKQAGEMHAACLLCSEMPDLSRCGAERRQLAVDGGRLALASVAFYEHPAPELGLLCA